MEREKAELTVELEDGTIAKVIARESTFWLVERADGKQHKIDPPNFTTEKADVMVERELGS